jgi:hypothetical protein
VHEPKERNHLEEHQNKERGDMFEVVAAFMEIDNLDLDGILGILIQKHQACYWGKK